MKTQFKNLAAFIKGLVKFPIMIFKTYLILMDNWSMWVDRMWKRYQAKMERNQPK